MSNSIRDTLATGVIVAGGLAILVVALAFLRAIALAVYHSVNEYRQSIGMAPVEFVTAIVGVIAACIVGFYILGWLVETIGGDSI